MLGLNLLARTLRERDASGPRNGQRKLNGHSNGQGKLNGHSNGQSKLNGHNNGQDPPPLSGKLKLNGHDHQGDLAKCPVIRLLPRPLQRQATSRAHLMEYLHATVGGDIGTPEYVEALDRSMRSIKRPNIIYPVGDGLFIHVFPDPQGSRAVYAAIEPGMFQELEELMEEVESRLVEFVFKMEEGTTEEERAQEILTALSQMVAIDGRTGTMKLGRGKKRLPVSQKEYEALRYMMVRDKVGLGPLQPLVDDPNIEDISCSGLGPLFVEHKIFNSLESNITFDKFAELDEFVERLAEKIGRPVTYREPIVDAVLPDGSRINIVYGDDLSKRGSNFTIRKFPEKPLSILQLIELGTMTYEMASYISLALGHGQNVFISGETASGKTTLLNAATTFIPFDAKIVSIEDTPELQVPHANWVREVVRGTSKSSGDSGVAMFDLLKAALRQRPNEIIIGEIRGEEGAIAFQAMQTGHSAMATFHASSVEKLIQRLTGNPINVPHTYIDNLNLVVIMSAVQLPDGSTGRRCISINEIVGYDPTTEGFSFLEAFRWDPVTDTFEFKGYMNSHLLEERVAPARGLPPQRKRAIYQEIDRRARILSHLHQQGVKDFSELYDILSAAYQDGTFR